jgi:hypothetical protein
LFSLLVYLLERVNRMSLLYTILFFIDTTVLVCLSFLFLEDMDNGSDFWMLTLIFSGIVACVIFLIILFTNYLKQPHRNRKKK